MLVNTIDEIKHHCDLCGHTESAFLIKENGFSICKCLDCNLIFVLDPPQRSEDDDVEYFYSQSQIDQNKNRYSDVNEYYSKKITDLRPERGRILDIGCGFGFFLDAARKCGWDVSGCDVSKLAIEYGKSTLKLDDLQLNSFYKDAQGDGFDVITMWNVFEHVPSPMAMLENVRSVLKPGGLLVIKVPNVGIQIPRYRISKQIPFYNTDISYIAGEPPQHLYGYTPATLAEYAKRGQFKSIGIDASYLSNPDIGKVKSTFVLCAKHVYKTLGVLSPGLAARVAPSIVGYFVLENH